MDGNLSAEIRSLLLRRNVAALATLHDGAPFASMVPFALLPDGGGFVVHVSGLAAHTRDMRADPRVSLLVTGEEREGVPAQALPRLTVVGRAVEASRDAPERKAAAAAYLDRFPEAEPMLGFADFAFFTIVPESGRWVGGFAQARSLSAAEVAEICTQPA